MAVARDGHGGMHIRACAYGDRVRVCLAEEPFIVVIGLRSELCGNTLSLFYMPVIDRSDLRTVFCKAGYVLVLRNYPCSDDSKLHSQPSCHSSSTLTTLPSLAERSTAAQRAIVFILSLSVGSAENFHRRAHAPARAGYPRGQSRGSRSLQRPVSLPDGRSRGKAPSPDDRTAI